MSVDRKDYFFGKESPLFFFEQPLKLTTLCGLCVDSEEVESAADRAHGNLRSF